MESLIADWYGFASLPLMSDGVIKWHAVGEEAILSDAMSLLEERCDLNFKRVNRRRRAEIRVVRQNGLIEGRSAGRAEWGHHTKFKWKLRVVNDPRYTSTVVHELGHALGLAHPDHHGENRKTMMSYLRDPQRNHWWRQDYVNLNEIYNPDKSDKITNPYVKSNDIKALVSTQPGVHRECETIVDYITGMPITSLSI